MSEGDDADRHVDEEHPAPAGDPEDLVGAGEEAADQRADEARDAEDGEEVALVFGALTWGEHVAHDRQRHRHQTTGAEALDGAEDGQLDHRGREDREDRADDEDDDRDDEQRPPAEDVGELAVDRRRDRRDDQVRGRDPRLLAEAVQVVADGADGGSDDGLVEGGEEHAGHEAEDHEQDLPVRHDRFEERPVAAVVWLDMCLRVESLVRGRPSHGRHTGVGAKENCGECKVTPAARSASNAKPSPGRRRSPRANASGGSTRRSCADRLDAAERHGDPRPGAHKGCRAYRGRVGPDPPPNPPRRLYELSQHVPTAPVASLALAAVAAAAALASHRMRGRAVAGDEGRRPGGRAIARARRSSVVSSIQPAAGSVSGGTVTLTGTNLENVERGADRRPARDRHAGERRQGRRERARRRELPGRSGRRHRHRQDGQARHHRREQLRLPGADAGGQAARLRDDATGRTTTPPSTATSTRSAATAPTS